MLSEKKLRMDDRSTPPVWPFKSDSSLFVPSADGLTEEDVAFLAALDRWVEFGLEQPEGRWWERIRRAAPDYDDRFCDDAALDVLRSPRVLLARMGFVGGDLRSAMAQSLAKFLSEPTKVLHCLTFAASEPSRLPHLAQLMVTQRETPDDLREWAREFLCVLREPELFPAGFALRHSHDLQSSFAGSSPDHMLLFERLDMSELSPELVMSEFFDMSWLQAQVRLLSWLLRSRQQFTSEVPAVLLRRVLDMLWKLPTVSPEAIVVALASWRQFDYPVAECKCTGLVEVMLEQFRHPRVRRRNLDAALHSVFDLHVDQHSEDTVRALLSCGASPLLCDDAGEPMIANLRAQRRHVRRDKVTLEKDILFAWHYEASRMVEVCQEFKPLHWTREQHGLFPECFRRRVFALLIANQRMRALQLVWLPRDPLQLVIDKLAWEEVLREVEVTETVSGDS